MRCLLFLILHLTICTIGCVNNQKSSTQSETPEVEVSKYHVVLPQSKPSSQKDAETRDPILISQPPIYPPNPNEPRIQGTVILRLTVSAAGDVIDAKIKKSLHPVLDKKLLEAVRGWKYKPALQNGKPIKANIDVPITLKIE